jgi:hypothetical protein
LECMRWERIKSTWVSCLLRLEDVPGSEAAHLILSLEVPTSSVGETEEYRDIDGTWSVILLLAGFPHNDCPPGGPARRRVDHGYGDSQIPATDLQLSRGRRSRCAGETGSRSLLRARQSLAQRLAISSQTPHRSLCSELSWWIGRTATARLPK